MSGIPRYVIVSPVKNEGEWLPLTVASVRGQTCPPLEWVVVDDGSTDSTRAILEEAATAAAWIHPVFRVNAGPRRPGPAVVSAFYEGFRALRVQDWDFLVKLDGDISFGEHYFEQIFSLFARRPELGIAGGALMVEQGGEPSLECRADPPFHVRGAVKTYRRGCWNAIGGIAALTGWDTLDELSANMLGWQTETLREVTALHHRTTGAAYGTWSDSRKNGLANYVVGYHPLFMLGKCFKRGLVRHQPLSALGLLAGYVGGYVRGSPRVEDRRLIRYVREQQLRHLFLRPSIWNRA